MLIVIFCKRWLQIAENKISSAYNFCACGINQYLIKYQYLIISILLHFFLKIKMTFLHNGCDPFEQNVHQLSKMVFILTFTTIGY